MVVLETTPEDISSSAGLIMASPLAPSWYWFAITFYCIVFCFLVVTMWGGGGEGFLTSSLSIFSFSLSFIHNLLQVTFPLLSLTSYLIFNSNVFNFLFLWSDLLFHFSSAHLPLLSFSLCKNNNASSHTNWYNFSKFLIILRLITIHIHISLLLLLILSQLSIHWKIMP